MTLFHYPPLDIPRFLAKVDTYPEQLAGIGCERQGIIFFIDLAESVFGCAVEFN